MAFDPVRDVTVLVGGVQAAGDSQTWEWHGTGVTPGLIPTGTWAASAQLPGGNRSFFAMGFDPVSQRIITHGGLGGAGGAETLSSTYAWDGAAWTLLSAGSAGVARSHTQMVYYPARNAMVMFGGLDAEGQAHNDLLEWNGVQWQAVAQQNPPYARQGHAFVYDPLRERLMVIGGFGNSHACTVDDVWEFDGSSWTRVGDTPAPCRGDANAVFDERNGHVALYNGSSVWAFSGGAPVITGVSWLPGPSGYVAPSWMRPYQPISIQGVASAVPVAYQWQVREDGGWHDLSDGPLVYGGIHIADVAGAQTASLRFPVVYRERIAEGANVSYRVVVANGCGQAVAGVDLSAVGFCGDIDYNNDGLFPDTLDLAAFLSDFSGGPCLYDSLPDDWQGCDSIDFNHDGLYPDALDIESYISVYSGGPCL